MSRKRKMRVAMKRDPEAYLRTIVGVKPLEHNQYLTLSLYANDALVSIKTPQARVEDWHNLWVTVESCKYLCKEQGYRVQNEDSTLTDPTPTLQAAAEGLQRAKQRCEKEGKELYLDGNAIRDMTNTLVVYDLFLKEVPQRVLEDLFKELGHRAKAAMALS